MMIDLFLPAGLKGIMVASLLAAFMSTIDTHLNWGTSYLINDLYKPFVNPRQTARHYVLISRIGMILLMAAALLVSTRLTSVLGAYKYLGVVFGGIGTVMIARWYWWRVNAYSEIAAIVTSLLVANSLQIALPSTPRTDWFAVRVVVTVSAVALVWVIVTLLTSGKTPDRHTAAFYAKMRIPGPGWKKVAQVAGVEPISGEFGQNLIGWLLCVTFIFSATLGLGKFILLQWKWGLVFAAAAIAAGCALRRTMRGMNFM
jgi:SSS family solute:Na+ symporter